MAKQKHHKKVKVDDSVTVNNQQSSNVNQPTTTETPVKKTGLKIKISNYFIDKKDNWVCWWTSLTSKQKILWSLTTPALIIFAIIILILFFQGKI